MSAGASWVLVVLASTPGGAALQRLVPLGHGIQGPQLSVQSTVQVTIVSHDMRPWIPLHRAHLLLALLCTAKADML